jgi:hypothetical protein
MKSAEAQSFFLFVEREALEDAYKQCHFLFFTFVMGLLGLTGYGQGVTGSTIRRGL